MESFIRNCVLHSRVMGAVVPGQVARTETLFAGNEKGEWLARLDGYAVIPKEEWIRLKALAGEAVER